MPIDNPSGGGGQSYNGDPTTITQDDTHRFVTDTEKSTWDAKVSTNDARLTDARTPTAHSHAISDTTGLTLVVEKIA